jgi:hypothetical protein
MAIRLRRQYVAPRFDASGGTTRAAAERRKDRQDFAEHLQPERRYFVFHGGGASRYLVGCRNRSGEPAYPGLPNR